jgi:hypothetical protein
MFTSMDTQQHRQTMSLDIDTKAIQKDNSDIDVRKTSQIDHAGNKIRNCQIDNLPDKVQNNNNCDQSALTMWDSVNKSCKSHLVNIDVWLCLAGKICGNE